MEQISYHLRTVGPGSSRRESASLICLRRATTIVGRNADQADYILCSASHKRNSCISRRHARIIRLERKFKLVDDSLNGIFVNDTKISGHVFLTEGDVVTFGHPNGERIPTGTKIRQPDSEFQYIFEQCSCSSSKEKECAQTSNQPIREKDAPQKSITQHLEAGASTYSPSADFKRPFTPPILSLNESHVSPNTGSPCIEERLRQISKQLESAVSPVLAKSASKAKYEKHENSSSDVKNTTMSSLFKAAMEPESCETSRVVDHSDMLTVDNLLGCDRKRLSDVEPRVHSPAKKSKTDGVDILPLKKEECTVSDKIVLLPETTTSTSKSGDVSIRATAAEDAGVSLETLEMSFKKVETPLESSFNFSGNLSERIDESKEMGLKAVEETPNKPSIEAPNMDPNKSRVAESVDEVRDLGQMDVDDEEVFPKPDVAEDCINASMTTGVDKDDTLIDSEVEEEKTSAQIGDLQVVEPSKEIDQNSAVCVTEKKECDIVCDMESDAENAKDITTKRSEAIETVDCVSVKSEGDSSDKVVDVCHAIEGTEVETVSVVSDEQHGPLTAVSPQQTRAELRKSTVWEDGALSLCREDQNCPAEGVEDTSCHLAKDKTLPGGDAEEVHATLEEAVDQKRDEVDEELQFVGLDSRVKTLVAEESSSVHEIQPFADVIEDDLNVINRDVEDEGKPFDSEMETVKLPIDQMRVETSEYQVDVMQTMDHEGEDETPPIQGEVNGETPPIHLEVEAETPPIQVEVDGKSLPIHLEVQGESPPIQVQVDVETPPIQVQVDGETPLIHLEVGGETLPIQVQVDGETPPIQVQVEGETPPIQVQVEGETLSIHLEDEGETPPIQVQVEGETPPIHHEDEGETPPIHVQVEGETSPIQVQVEGETPPIQVHVEGETQPIQLEGADETQPLQLEYEDETQSIHHEVDEEALSIHFDIDGKTRPHNHENDKQMHSTDQGKDELMYHEMDDGFDVAGSELQPIYNVNHETLPAEEKKDETHLPIDQEENKLELVTDIDEKALPAVTDKVFEREGLKTTEILEGDPKDQHASEDKEYFPERPSQAEEDDCYGAHDVVDRSRPVDCNDIDIEEYAVEPEAVVEVLTETTSAVGREFEVNTDEISSRIENTTDVNATVSRTKANVEEKKVASEDEDERDYDSDGNSIHPSDEELSDLEAYEKGVKRYYSRSFRRWYENGCPNGSDDEEGEEDQEDDVADKEEPKEEEQKDESIVMRRESSNSTITTASETENHTLDSPGIFLPSQETISQATTPSLVSHSVLNSSREVETNESLHLFMEVSQISQDVVERDLANADYEEGLRNSEQDIFSMDTQNVDAVEDEIFDMNTQLMIRPSVKKRLKLPEVTFTDSDTDDAESDGTKETTLVSGSQEEDEDAGSFPGLMPSGSREYDVPASPEIPYHPPSPLPDDEPINCSFESEAEEFSCPNVNLDCLDSQNINHPPVVIQPTDCSQASMAFDSPGTSVGTSNFAPSKNDCAVYTPSSSNDNSTSDTPRSGGKVGSILERIKAKKAIKREGNSPLKADSPFIEPVTPTGALKRASNVDNIGDHIAKSRTIINDLNGIICGPSKLQQLPRVKAWREEIENLQSRLEVPKTVIAVVGDTGAGKSSLMNAVLDHADILPTSGMRACTAVVVEISESKSGSYESDIEFLSEKEWYDELEMLLTDLQGTDGRVKARQPDPQTEAGVAWSKIRAVYGVFQDGITLNRLKRQRGVTHWLGRTRRIKETSASSFRKQIDRYIESTDTGQGGDYWPIVKHVSVRIPNCYACSSGAILVDLPGIRDSNAARDKIARQFLKKCSAVWVVASIHRAVDDRTAKELLGEHFRRQLLMDGQYGAISFVCTKTDILVPSEIIRALDLTKQCEPFENEIAVLEAEVLDQSIKIEEMEKENEEGRKRIEELREEMREEENDIMELSQALVGEEDTEGKEELQQMQGTFRNQQQEVDELDDKIRKNRSSVRELRKKKLELESSINIRQKDISALCSKARSQYSTHQIRKDFRAGLRVMRCQAGLTNEEDEEEENEDFDEEEKGLAEAVQNLNVFCVSSTEYLKLCNKLPKDGPPAVFRTKDDTGIPKLQKFVHEVTELRRLQATERLIRSVGRTVADILSYIADQGTKDGRVRSGAREIFDVHLNELKISKVSQILSHTREQIVALFETCLKPRICDGSGQAQHAAFGTVTKWGSKVNREKREEGGYAWSTYKATVRRDGAYKSPTCGQIDFNENLASPFYSAITVIWNSVFNGQLQRLLEGCKTSILDSLKRFGAALVNDLKVLGMAPERVNRVYAQHFASAENKLRETILTIQDMITDRQREASRVVTPSIQGFMQPAYSHCAQESGPGQYQRMKNHMQTFVTGKLTMFTDSAKVLLVQINELQEAIMVSLDTALQEVMQDLIALYEPLWEAPINTQLLREHFLPGLIGLKQPVLDMYNGADITTDVSEIETLKREIVISSTPLQPVKKEKKIQVLVTNPVTPTVKTLAPILAPLCASRQSVTPVKKPGTVSAPGSAPGKSILRPLSELSPKPTLADKTNTPQTLKSVNKSTKNLSVKRELSLSPCKQPTKKIKNLCVDLTLSSDEEFKSS